MVPSCIRGTLVTKERTTDSAVPGPIAICVQAAEVAQLVSSPGAHVFICGDGARMAQDVHAALVEVLTQHGTQSSSGASMTQGQAAAHLAEMTKQQRYVRDIWS